MTLMRNNITTLPGLTRKNCCRFMICDCQCSYTSQQPVSTSNIAMMAFGHTTKQIVLSQQREDGGSTKPCIPGYKATRYHPHLLLPLPLPLPSPSPPNSFRISVIVHDTHLQHLVLEFLLMLTYAHSNGHPHFSDTMNTCTCSFVALVYVIQCQY